MTFWLNKQDDAVRIDPSQICLTSLKSSSVWLPGGSHHICLILVFYQPDSPPTVPPTPRRRRCCPCITTWLAPSTTVKFHCSCCLTSAQLSTPWIIKFYCQYYPNALLWPTPHSAGSALTSLTAHNSSRTLGVVQPVSQWTVVCHKDRYYTVGPL